MDVLKILKESGDELQGEDLDLFEEILALGDYSRDGSPTMSDAAYRRECADLIKALRCWGEQEAVQGSADAPETSQADSTDARGLTVGLGGRAEDAVPRSQDPNQGEGDLESVQKALASMRKSKDYKKRFKRYVTKSPLVTEAFVDANFSVFQSWEMDHILSAVGFSEVFLEKYFDALNHEKMAKHQLFSESFFMKHYGSLDANLVLRHGRNPWRAKENRSSQLDVFLRLKGVKF